jgi:glycine dehydrogenase subunit 1
MRYIPNSPADRAQMLAEIGLTSIDQLFSGIPERLRLKRLLNLPKALTEPELVEYFQARAAKNSLGVPAFTGAGVYPHYIPIIVDALISRSEFYTAYTPYQAEIAQGTLQAIFEFQTYIAQLTGMEVANASLYDGSTGLAEAVLMAHRINKKNRFLIASTVHPEYRAVVDTYAKNLGIRIEIVPYATDGRIDLDRLEQQISDDVAAVVVQSPNFFGTIEHTHDLAELAHRRGALAIVNIAEAISLGILKPPGQDASEQRTADIVVGEAQSFGIPPSFGGPHLGFLATRDRYVRQMPGRLVGMGKDNSGKPGFVLTLSTREQHIRREKATSNICTNQSLCALMATVYLATVGPRGLREVAEQNILKASYAAEAIAKRTKRSALFPGARFNEFVVEVDGPRNVGIPLSRYYPELGNSILLCVTETARREEIDAMVERVAS